MIKVVHIINGLDVGGAEISLAQLIEIRDANLISVEVISLTDAGPVAERIQNAGITVRTLGLNPRAPNPLLFFKLRSWLRELSPDIVQTWMYHSNLIGGIAAKLSGVRHILWGIRQTNVDAQSISRLTAQIVRIGAWLSRRVPSTIVSNSVASRDAHIALGYDASRFEVIPNGFDFNIFRPNPASRLSLGEEIGVDAGCVIVGLVARFDKQKDHENLVLASAEISAKYADVHFVLCGLGIDANNSLLTGWIKENGLSDRFHLLGPRTDISLLTAGFDIAVSSSLGEGFANNIGEAMACAVPCVATDVGDSRIVIGDTGFVVPPRSPSALATSIGRMIDIGPNGRGKLGSAARLRIQKNYALPRMATSFEELYVACMRSN